MSKYPVALVATAAIAGLASQVMAQQVPAQQVPAQDVDEKDVAIAICMKQAQAQHPDDGATGLGGRTVYYKACMNAGGFKP
jgi:hypothetical protein